MNEPEVTPSEIVPAAAQPAVNPIALEDNPAKFTHVSVFTDPEGNEYQLKHKEQKFIASYLRGLNTHLACAEVGWSLRTGQNFIRREGIKNYLAYKIRQKAEAAGLTEDKILSMLNQGVDGRMQFTESQQFAIKESTKFLRPTGKGIQVNVQTNVTTNVPSPYTEMSAEQLAVAMKSRLEAMGAQQIGSPSSPGIGG